MDVGTPTIMSPACCLFIDTGWRTRERALEWPLENAVSTGTTRVVADGGDESRDGDGTYIGTGSATRGVGAEGFAGVGDLRAARRRRRLTGNHLTARTQQPPQDARATTR